MMKSSKKELSELEHEVTERLKSIFENQRRPDTTDNIIHTIDRYPALVPEIAKTLVKTGITEPEADGNGHYATMLKDSKNNQMVKLNPVYHKMQVKNEDSLKKIKPLLLPFQYTQRIDLSEQLGVSPAAPDKPALDAKIYPRLKLISEFGGSTEATLRKLTIATMANFGVSTDVYGENIGVISDANDNPVKVEIEGGGTTMIPITFDYGKIEDANSRYIRRFARPDYEPFYSIWNQSGKDKYGEYNTTVEKYYPQLRNGGIVIAQNDPEGKYVKMLEKQNKIDSPTLSRT